MEEKIRTMEHEGMLVYHLADCIKLIGKGNPSAVKKKIDTDEIMLLEYQGKAQPANFITEKGIGIMEEFYLVDKGRWLNLFRENSVKILEQIETKALPLATVEEEILSPLTSISFYGYELSVYGTLENPLFVAVIGYSGLIFMYNQEYYQIFLTLGAPLSFAIPFFIEYKTSLTDNEREVRKEIREAREFLEKSSGKADNEGINALVELYRSGREDRKWESINDMLREAFPEKSELSKAVSGIIEK